MSSAAVVIGALRVNSVTQNLRKALIDSVTEVIQIFKTLFSALTLLHSDRPKLYTILAFLSAIGLKCHGFPG